MSFRRRLWRHMFPTYSFPTQTPVYQHTTAPSTSIGESADGQDVSALIAQLVDCADLYKAFAPAGWGLATTCRATKSPPVSDEWPLPPLPCLPSSINRPWTTTHTTTPTSSTQNLARPPSIHCQRSCMVDFHKYAHCQRSNVHNSLNGSQSDAAERQHHQGRLRKEDQLVRLRVPTTCSVLPSGKQTAWCDARQATWCPRKRRQHTTRRHCPRTQSTSTS